MKMITTFLFVLSAVPAFSTHILGGYIQVRNVSPATYEIIVRLYLERSGTSQQEISIPVCFDDGSEPVTAARSSSLALEGGILLNEYRTTRSFNGSGSGNRTVAVSIPNRTDSRNVPSALSIPFYIQTTFTTAQINTTPVFEDLDNRLTGLANQKVEYNFLAKDSEGDSVVHYLVRVQSGGCDQGGQPVAGYTFPNDVTRRGVFSVGPQTGQLVWNAPTETGNYGFAVAAEEWRNGQRISETVFDMIALIVDNAGGTPGTIPPYEPALPGGLLTGWEEPSNDPDITVAAYPSPSPNRFLVKLKSRKPTTATFQLLDNQGRLIQEVTTRKASQEIEERIGPEKLAPGLYLIRTSVRGRVYTSKVLKQ
ncbi:T9SS type A sorting domain-containing protein [Larkinella insperata]|uniref:T9SS type A sorting domain-containing protein n=1 Tax=Larkinella insperata TaxID=332158 RepID=A0ABW3Q960_9BACT|nr:T9SS type A sorting domain-containing protein [Larkinella insperata]